MEPTGDKVAGANDAGGTPFWFNGQDNLFFAGPLVQQQNFGKSLKYSGKNRVQSGLPLADKPKPMVVSFTKKGRYTYYCNVHPGMKATVTVQRKGATRPTAARDKRVVKQQVNAATKVAKDLQGTRPEDGTIDIGAAGRAASRCSRSSRRRRPCRSGPRSSSRCPRAAGGPHRDDRSGNPETEPSSYLGTLAASLRARRRSTRLRCTRATRPAAPPRR